MVMCVSLPQGLWFRWGLNTTAVQDLVAEQALALWDPVIVVGYNYNGNLLHFVAFRRKLLH